MRLQQLMMVKCVGVRQMVVRECGGVWKVVAAESV